MKTALVIACNHANASRAEDDGLAVAEALHAAGWEVALHLGHAAVSMPWPKPNAVDLIWVSGECDLQRNYVVGACRYPLALLAKLGERAVLDCCHGGKLLKVLAPGASRVWCASDDLSYSYDGEQFGRSMFADAILDGAREIPGALSPETFMPDPLWARVLGAANEFEKQNPTRRQRPVRGVLA